MHAGKPNPARQLIEFVEKAGQLSEAAKTSSRKILTNVERLLETPYVREKLGLDLVQGDLVVHYPAAELAKGLTRVVEDLKTGKITVPDLYHAQDRRDYADALPKAALPKQSTRLAAPVRLEDLTAGVATPRPVTTKPTRRPRRPPRTTLIPKTSQLDVKHPRLNRIYNELLNLSAEQYPNACSVLLRVFIELSVDHYISNNKLLNDKELRDATLAKKLRLTATELEKQGEIPTKLRQAVETIASGKVLGPSVFTLHQYVHNEFVFPKSADMYSAWDELEPFVLKLSPQS